MPRASSSSVAVQLQTSKSEENRLLTPWNKLLLTLWDISHMINQYAILKKTPLNEVQTNLLSTSPRSATASAAT